MSSAQLDDAMSNALVEPGRRRVQLLEPCCEIEPEASNLLYEMCFLHCTCVVVDADIIEHSVVVAARRSVHG